MEYSNLAKTALFTLAIDMTSCGGRTDSAGNEKGGGSWNTTKNASDGVGFDNNGSSDSAEGMMDTTGSGNNRTM